MEEPMFTRLTVANSAIFLCLVLAAAVPAGEKGGAAAEKSARDLLAKFEAADPGWKVRMTGLVELARGGPACVPALIEGLKSESPRTREFAAQALVMFADPSIRPALDQALDDSKSGVRIYAIHALSMLGPLEATERHERLLRTDRSYYGVRTMMAAALAREDKPKPAELRKELADYDLRQLDSARVGEMAPDFTLLDFKGNKVRLSQFRGKKTVVLRFILFDF
jgi:HEAT repeat protein